MEMRERLAEIAHNYGFGLDMFPAKAPKSYEVHVYGYGIGAVYDISTLRDFANLAAMPLLFFSVYKGAYDVFQYHEALESFCVAASLELCFSQSAVVA